jgi:membrane associated rhomboid family serine protease
MIPLSDDTRRPVDFPIVTVAIIVINTAVFLVELAAGDAFVAQWAAIPAKIAAGQRLETLITSMFMHGGWSHIIGNMIYFWAFGPQVEDAMGRVRYALFYLVGGIVAMLAQIAADPTSTVPSLGASGAIAAVMGAFLVTYPQDRIRTVLILGWFVRITLVPAIFLIGFWFVVQLVSLGSITGAQAGQSGGVAYMAHVGGLVFGAATARLIERRREPAPMA